jgi:RNA polymerase sigma-70 factor, ECF subfamily
VVCTVEGFADLRAPRGETSRRENGTAMPSKQSDVAIEMVGTRTWFSGRATCLRYLAHVIGSPGDWRMTPTVANGQPAAVAQYRDSAYGLGVLTVTPAGITRITVFGGSPSLVARFARRD